jgi:hypothetical protein
MQESFARHISESVLIRKALASLTSRVPCQDTFPPTLPRGSISEVASYLFSCPQVKITREIPAEVYERELPLLIEQFRAHAAQKTPLHTGRLPGNFMLVANIRQEWHREASGRVLRAHVVEPDLVAREHGATAKRPNWPVLVRLVPGAEVTLDCSCGLKASGGRCYHKGVLEALHPELRKLPVYGSEDALLRTGGSVRKPTFKELNGTVSKALTWKVRDPEGDGSSETVTFFIFHDGASGTLIAERKQGRRQGGVANEWACVRCPLGKTDLEGRCRHSYRAAGLTTFVPQGDGVDNPSCPEETWGQDFGVKPYPKLGTATAVVCTACPRGYRNLAEDAAETQAHACPHLAELPLAQPPPERSAGQLRERPILFGSHLRVAHVCTTACNLRPCGQLPPRHDRVDQTAEHDASLREVSEWCAMGTFCQDRPAGPPPCGGSWRLEWTNQARLLRSNSLQAICLGTWRCHPPCQAQCALKFDAASIGLYFLSPEVLCTQPVLKSLEDALYKHQSLAEAAQTWDAIARRTSGRCLDQLPDSQPIKARHVARKLCVNGGL